MCGCAFLVAICYLPDLSPTYKIFTADFDTLNTVHTTQYAIPNTPNVVFENMNH